MRAGFILTLCDDSTTDDDALRAKVDEALAVYDEYVKNQGGPGGPEEAATTNGGGAENVDPATGQEGKEVET